MKKKITIDYFKYLEGKLLKIYYHTTAHEL